MWRGMSWLSSVTFSGCGHALARSCSSSISSGLPDVTSSCQPGATRMAADLVCFKRAMRTNLYFSDGSREAIPFFDNEGTQFFSGVGIELGPFLLVKFLHSDEQLFPLRTRDTAALERLISTRKLDTGCHASTAGVPVHDRGRKARAPG